jgi:hypothetical protein
MTEVPCFGGRSPTEALPRPAAGLLESSQVRPTAELPEVDMNRWCRVHNKGLILDDQDGDISPMTPKKSTEYRLQTI